MRRQLPSVTLLALTACLLGAVLSAVPSAVWGQQAENVPRAYVGKWRGVSGKAEAHSVRVVRTVTTTRQFGHKIDEFEFEVKEDGTITGSGKATYWFNVSAIGSLIVVPVGASSYLEGNMQARDFTIAGKMKQDGSVTLNGTPAENLILINAGKRQEMGAWNVFGPQTAQVQSGCRPVVESSQTLAQIAMKLEWKAKKKCGADCSVNQEAPVPGNRRTQSKIDTVVLHATGGPDPDCKGALFFKGWELPGIVAEFERAAKEYEDYQAARKKGEKPEKTGLEKTIHYIVGRDGKVARMVPEHEAGAHIQKGNLGKIGIELVNNGDPDGEDKYKEPQISALIELLAEILCRYDLDASALKGHTEFEKRTITCPNPVYKGKPYIGPRRIDPGPAFPWDEVRRRVTERLKQDQ